MTAKIFMAVYRPHPGCEETLRALVAKHYPVLKQLGFVTDRPPWLMRAEKGSLVEIGEWVSEAAAGKAHGHPQVEALWEAMAEVADFQSLGSLEEAGRMFPHFDPLHP